jgi:hypothetical protein
MLYLTSKSVPELSSLSSFERVKVIVAAERASEATVQSKRMKWAWAIFCGYLPLAVLLIAQDHLGLSSWVGLVLFVLSFIAGLGICEHLRMHYLRPYMQEYLAKVALAPNTWPNQVPDIIQLHRELQSAQSRSRTFVALALGLGVFVLVYNLLAAASGIPWLVRLAMCIVLSLLLQAVVDLVARFFPGSVRS